MLNDVVVLTSAGREIENGTFDNSIWPYDEPTPFGNCRVIGAISVRSAEAILDADDFPVVEVLGGLGVEGEEGAQRVVPLVEGFDTVTSLGSIGNPFGFASIGEISGFNNVEEVDNIEANATLSGFTRLRRVTGLLDVKSLPGPVELESVGTLHLGGGFRAVNLPLLQDVAGDLIVDGSRLTDLEFPTLAHVGGNVEVTVNDFLSTWRGFAQGAIIEGDFEAQGNVPVRNERFVEWIEESGTIIRGTTLICNNGPITDDEVGTCVE